MSDFWARKLGGSQYGRGGRREEASYSRPPAHAPAPASPALQQQMPGDYAPRQAEHLANPGTCPKCTSGSYIRAGENVKPRCYTCGYPLLHTTSGLIATTQDQRTIAPTRQVPMSLTSGYSPQMIIGRV